MIKINEIDFSAGFEFTDETYRACFPEGIENMNQDDLFALGDERVSAIVGALNRYIERKTPKGAQIDRYVIV